MSHSDHDDVAGDSGARASNDDDDVVFIGTKRKAVTLVDLTNSDSNEGEDDEDDDEGNDSRVSQEFVVPNAFSEPQLWSDSLSRSIEDVLLRNLHQQHARNAVSDIAKEIRVAIDAYFSRGFDIEGEVFTTPSTWIYDMEAAIEDRRLQGGDLVSGSEAGEKESEDGEDGEDGIEGDGCQKEEEDGDDGEDNEDGDEGDGCQEEEEDGDDDEDSDNGDEGDGCQEEEEDGDDGEDGDNGEDGIEGDDDNF